MRPVTKHIGLAKQIPDVKRIFIFNTLPSISRASSSNQAPDLVSLFFFFLRALLRVVPASMPHHLPHRSGGDLSLSNLKPAKQRRSSSYSGGATRLPDIACPCLHLGLPCAVRPVSLPVSSANPFPSGSHSLSFYPSLLPLYSVDHKLLEYRRSGLAPPLVGV
jgi:hypothetical protein